MTTAQPLFMTTPPPVQNTARVMTATVMTTARAAYDAEQNTAPVVMTRAFDFMTIYDYDKTFYDNKSKEALRGVIGGESAFWGYNPIKSKEGRHGVIKTPFMTRAGVMMQNDADNTPHGRFYDPAPINTPQTRVLPLSIRAFVKLKSDFGFSQ